VLQASFRTMLPRTKCTTMIYNHTPKKFMKSCTIAKVCLKSFKKSPRDCHPVSFEAEIFWLHDFSSLILVSLTIRSLNFFDIVCKNCPKFAELLACILSGVLCKKESKFLSFSSTTSNSCKCTYRKVALFTVRQSTLSPIIPRRQRKVFWLCLFPTLSNNPLQKTNCHK